MSPSSRNATVWFLESDAWSESAAAQFNKDEGTSPEKHKIRPYREVLPGDDARDAEFVKLQNYSAETDYRFHEANERISELSRKVSQLTNERDRLKDRLSVVGDYADENKKLRDALETMLKAFAYEVGIDFTNVGEMNAHAKEDPECAVSIAWVALKESER